jgi:hypothetical protein
MPVRAGVFVAAKNHAADRLPLPTVARPRGIKLSEI